MTLGRGDTGDDVKVLQRRLNRIGALLLIDGEFGEGTEAAVLDAREALGLPPSPTSDDALETALDAVDDLCPELTEAGVTFIAREEVSSPSAYRKKFRNPIWPGADSGITIGIGYDLRFVDERKLRADWDAVLPTTTLDGLVMATGRRGTAQLLAGTRAHLVPLPAAVRVFLRASLPDHIAVTRRVYPSLDSLPAARRTALISLIFNRGGRLDGPRRSEMQRIRDLLGSGDVEPVADEFESMTRHWNPATAAGLIERRRREATLWRSGFGGLRLE
jgi:peptidoglycan hydrolase-like protein with peptidoglycan-binding domain